jgi:toxin ParE1/3/4
LYDYIRTDSGPATAERVVSRLIAACEALNEFPERGFARDDLFPGLRVMGYRRQATVAFTIEPQTVTVHGVLWRGRDLNALFADEE